MTPPMVPEPLFEKVAPLSSSMRPVTYSLPVRDNLLLGPIQTFPKIPPAGPVIDTLCPPPSCSTVQSPACLRAGFTQLLLVPVLVPQSNGMLPQRKMFVEVPAANENGPGRVQRDARMGSVMTIFVKSALPVLVTTTL